MNVEQYVNQSAEQSDVPPKVDDLATLQSIVALLSI